MTRKVKVRAAHPKDLLEACELERAAGAAFQVLGMAAVADDEPPSIAELTTFQQDSRAWVITDDADRPLAYLLLDVVDAYAHVEQVSVHPITSSAAVVMASARVPSRCPVSALTSAAAFLT